MVHTEQAPHNEDRQPPEGEAAREEVIHATTLDGRAQRLASIEKASERHDADPVVV